MYVCEYLIIRTVGNVGFLVLARSDICLYAGLLYEKYLP